MNNINKQDRLITAKEVSALTTLSASTIRKLLKIGRFPRKITLSRNKVVWSAIAVQTWIDHKVKGRNWCANVEVTNRSFFTDIESGRYRSPEV